MAKDNSFHDYVMSEVFRDIPGVTSRHMFGDWGLYKDGIFFALIADGRLYFKVGENNKTDFEKAGSEPFEYTAKGKKIKLNYYELPAEVMEDPDQIVSWIEKSVTVAKNAKKA
ncbi:MAG: TfoX/Sxy family protein [Candidatus Woykebacteria bacterium]